MGVFLVLVVGGRDYFDHPRRQKQHLVYKRFSLLPIGWLYTTYHPLQEHEQSIDQSETLSVCFFFFFRFSRFFFQGLTGEMPFTMDKYGIQGCFSLFRKEWLVGLVGPRFRTKKDHTPEFRSSWLFKMSHAKKPSTFHYTGWIIGILLTTPI